MPPTFLDTFRVLASFAPARQSLKGAPWEAYVGWAVANGLAALAAHNLEYRLAGGDAPDWVRDQLRFQSTKRTAINDNAS